MWIYKAEEKSLADLRVCFSVVLWKRHGRSSTLDTPSSRSVDWLIDLAKRWWKGFCSLSVPCRMVLKSVVDKFCFNGVLDDTDSDVQNLLVILENILMHRCKPKGTKIPLSFPYLHSILTFDFQPRRVSLVRGGNIFLLALRGVVLL